MESDSSPVEVSSAPQEDPSTEALTLLTAATARGPARLDSAGAAAAAASCELRPQTSRKNLSRLAIQGRPDQHQPVPVHE